MSAEWVIHWWVQEGAASAGGEGSRGEAARVHGGKGIAHEQREIGGKKGHGALLTTPGCCDDGWRPRIEGAGVESRWRKVGWRQRCPRVERRRGGARAQRGAEGGSGG
jgi:hypothetical protein